MKFDSKDNNKTRTPQTICQLFSLFSHNERHTKIFSIVLKENIFVMY